MLGVIAGDVIGSVFEGRRDPPAGFALFGPGARFTDDTVLAIAVAHAVPSGGDFQRALLEWGRRYPHAGYGAAFRQWLASPQPAPYGSFGNGSAMRVAAIGWAFDDLEQVLAEAEGSAAVTHDHPEGIKGAQAVAAVVHAARRGADKRQLAALLTERFGYDCGASVDEVRRRGGIQVTCQDTLPAAAVALLHSRDFEDAVRIAVSFGGDTDTVASIAGAMAEAHYGGVPAAIREAALARLDAPLRAEALGFARACGVPMPPGASS